MTVPYQRSAGPSATILVVEDEILIRMDLADYLRECGYHVIEASNADEAMAVLQSGREVGVALADVQMPGSMDGFGACPMGSSEPAKHQGHLNIEGEPLG